jgi:uncharacterized protein
VAFLIARRGRFDRELEKIEREPAEAVRRLRRVFQCTAGPARERGMKQRLSLITLGVADVPRSRRFYEALGWRASGASQEEVTFVQLGGIALALWGRAALAGDASVTDDRGFAGVALADNARTREAVDAILAEARAAGESILKPAQPTPWGGYAGYFADPDGHLWEVAWNPKFALHADGSIRLPD